MQYSLIKVQVLYVTICVLGVYSFCGLRLNFYHINVTWLKPTAPFAGTASAPAPPRRGRR